MDKAKIAEWMINIFAIFGILFFMILIHEIVHVIDGHTPNVAVCFGFISWHRMGFVINGDHYSLYRGELLAYSVNVLTSIGLVFLIRYYTHHQ